MYLDYYNTRDSAYILEYKKTLVQTRYAKNTARKLLANNEFPIEFLERPEVCNISKEMLTCITAIVSAINI